MDEIGAIKQRLRESQNEMLSTLQQLIGINSEAAEPEKDCPFGKGVSDAFLYMLKKAEEDGFKTVNTDNYGGHIELSAGENADGLTMGILGHLDVVPAGSGWDFDPFGGEIKDGRIYGRGAEDDKGPTLAAYYAMKAIKDCGIELKKNVRLILGLDEETEWEGIKYYLEHEEAPDFGFTPDADFPVVHGEKGILIFDLAQKFKKTGTTGIELRKFTGGNAPNMVADSARMVIYSKDQSLYDGIKDKVKAYREETGYDVKAKGAGKSLEITATGISSHGAEPQKGLNAISILMGVAENIEFDNEGVNDFIAFYNERLAFETDGTSFGINLKDEVSGGTVVNVGMIEADKNSARLSINVRFPVTFDDEMVYSALGKTLENYDIGVVKKKYQEPLFVEKDDPMVVTLMDVYKNVTGDTAAEPMIIGGGTYARAAEGFVAFGAKFPGEEEKAHQKNESASIENLMKAAEIYAEAIYRLCV